MAVMGSGTSQLAERHSPRPDPIPFPIPDGLSRHPSFLLSLRGKAQGLAPPNRDADEHFHWTPPPEPRRAETGRFGNRSQALTLKHLPRLLSYRIVLKADECRKL